MEVGAEIEAEGFNTHTCQQWSAQERRMSLALARTLLQVTVPLLLPIDYARSPHPPMPSTSFCRTLDLDRLAFLGPDLKPPSRTSPATMMMNAVVVVVMMFWTEAGLKNRAQGRPGRGRPTVKGRRASR